MSQLAKILAVSLITTFVLASGFALFKDVPPIVDESLYYLQVREILHHDIQLPDRAPVLPGYPLSMAALVNLFRDESGSGLRLISTGLSFFCLWLFSALARRFQPDTWFSASIEFLFLPILFPFFFLIYTDVYSMLWFFLCLAGAFHKKFFLSALAGAVSVLTRQNNILWVFFIWLMIYLDHFGPGLDLAKARRFMKATWGFLTVMAGFGFFLILNKGPTIGDKSLHPVTVGVGNLFFCLFVFFFIFLPFHIAQAGKIATLLKKDRRPLIGLGLALLLYLIFFRPNHFYNSPVVFAFFLRNRLLGFMSSNLWTLLLCFLPIAVSLLSLAATQLNRKSYYLLYPVTFLFLTLLPLIEQRYYLIPFSLFMLFREKESPKIAYATVVLYLLCLCALLPGILQGKFFL